MLTRTSQKDEVLTRTSQKDEVLTRTSQKDEVLTRTSQKDEMLTRTSQKDEVLTRTSQKDEVDSRRKEAWASQPAPSGVQPASPLALGMVVKHETRGHAASQVEETADDRKEDEDPSESGLCVRPPDRPTSLCACSALIMDPLHTSSVITSFILFFYFYFLGTHFVLLFMMLPV